jgi:hypothetical protein
MRHQRDGVVYAAVAGTVAVVALLSLAFSGPETPEFDCDRDEVGVWVDYGDRKMECVPATDHEAHQGDRDG